MNPNIQAANQKEASSNPENIRQSNGKAVWQSSVQADERAMPDYWTARIFRPTYTRNGKQSSVKAYSVKIQSGGVRKTYPLGTSDAATAAARASEIWRNLHPDTSAKLPPLPPLPPRPPAPGPPSPLPPLPPLPTPKPRTVGEHIAAATASSMVSPGTLRGYIGSLRLVVSGVFDLSPGKGRNTAGQGLRDWMAKVDAVPLSTLTPAALRDWRKEFVGRAGTDGAKLHRARVSVNSIIRQASALFLSDLESDGDEHPVNPFAALSPLKAPPRPYRSSLDTPAFIAKAREELHGETLLAFLLALGAGLRWSEIRSLEWWDVSAAAPEIHLVPKAGYSGKTESSLAPVRIDDALHAIILTHRKPDFATDPATLPVLTAPKKARTELTAWLRKNGLDVEKPIHELRKEYGALIATRHGIYAASRALRHSNISTTASIYADLKTSPAPGIFA